MISEIESQSDVQRGWLVKTLGAATSSAVFLWPRVVKLIKFFLVIVILWLLGKSAIMGYNKYTEYQTTRMHSICPTQLSIARSARDSLLIMKTEPLCNTYVLMNLE